MKPPEHPDYSGFEHVIKWINSIPLQGRSMFEAYGDIGRLNAVRPHFVQGTVWFSAIPKLWTHSLYDTCELARKGNRKALLILSNYMSALVAHSLTEVSDEHRQHD